MNVDDELAAAREQGRICALVARGERDLQRCAAEHPELFAAPVFDTGLFSAVARAIAFGAPWCTAEQLRLANRAVLWGFAVDWLIDHEATHRTQVEALVNACLAVADDPDAVGSDPLSRFLAELRDELASAPAFERLRPTWRDALARMLLAMAREWDWRAGCDGTAGDAPLPGFAEYLANADNLACTFVNVSHWIYSGTAETLEQLPELLLASDEVQRILRLVNDLGTYERDLRWGDLNALRLVPDREVVEREIRVLTERCRKLLAPLAVSCPREAAYLARQIGFSSGFYRSADFWGQRQ